MGNRITVALLFVINLVYTENVGKLGASQADLAFANALMS